MTTKPTQPKAGRALATYVRAIAFTTVEVLAALQLDGILALGLWAIAAWNVGVLVTLTIGLAFMAEEHMKEGAA